MKWLKCKTCAGCGGILTHTYSQGRVATSTQRTAYQGKLPACMIHFQSITQHHKWRTAREVPLNQSSYYTEKTKGRFTYQKTCLVSSYFLIHFNQRIAWQVPLMAIQSPSPTLKPWCTYCRLVLKKSKPVAPAATELFLLWKQSFSVNVSRKCC